MTKKILFMGYAITGFSRGKWDENSNDDGSSCYRRYCIPEDFVVKNIKKTYFINKMDALVILFQETLQYDIPLYFHVQELIYVI